MLQRLQMFQRAIKINNSKLCAKILML
jgi:hypothetical protein